MLFAVSGSKLLIGGADYSPRQWVEVRSTQSLGLLGGAWNLIDLSGQDDTSLSRFMKGGRAQSQMQIICGVDPEDEGQLQLYAAYQDEAAWRFRLEFPGASSWRQFSALVIGMGEAFDAANEVILLQVTLQINSEIYRG